MVVSLVKGTKGIVGSLYAHFFGYTPIVGAQVEFLGFSKYADSTLCKVRLISKRYEEIPEMQGDWHITPYDFLPLSPASNEEALCCLSESEE